MESNFSLTDDQLKVLINSFSDWYEKNEDEKKYPNQFREKGKNLKKTLLNNEYLSKISNDDLAQQIFEYSRTLEGPAHIRLGMERISNNIPQIKRNLKYLIESPDDPFKKAQEILDGKYRIPIFAKAFWTPLFQAQFPKKLPNWNNKTENFFKKVGINLRTNKLSIEEKYRLLSSAFFHLQNLDPNNDFYTLNHLMHYGTVIDEGVNLIEILLKPEQKPKSKMQNKISKWRTEHVSEKRINVRKKAEKSARDLLSEKAGNLDQSSLKKFFELINEDYWQGKVNHSRFGQAYTGHNLNQIVEQLDKVNEWIDRLWRAPEAELKQILNEYYSQKPIKNAGRAFPSLILYIRDPDRFNNCFHRTIKGLKNLTGFPDDGYSGEFYFEYNDKVNQLKKEYALMPEEMDIILSLGGSETDDFEPNDGNIQYWTYAPGEDASEWEELYKNGLMAIGWRFLGDLKQYSSKDQIRKNMQDHYKEEGSHKNRTLACFEFLKKVKIGDVIFAKKGLKKVIGYGIVESDYFFDTTRKKYQHVRKVQWKSKGEWDVGDDKIALKTLTNITKYKNFVEKLKALVNFDESNLESENYWWLIANPEIWKFYDYGVGQRQIYTIRNEKGNKRRIFKHFKKVKPDELIFCYSATPDKELVGKSKVTKSLHQTEEGEGFEFEIIEKFKNTISWSELQETSKLKNSEPILHNNQGSLFKLNKEEFEIIQKMVADRNDGIQKERIWEEFQDNLAITNLKKKFAIKFLYFENKDRIENKIQLALKNNKHIILIGPPGTGKSKLAKEICEFYCENNNYIMSTATSDWSTFETIGGYRPDSKGKLHFNSGIFLKCFQNKIGNPQNFWLIIDEINRADIDKAFGSLFSSLTGDNISLPYDIDGDQFELIGSPVANDKITTSKFIIHPHWRIIATMNTFDKTSLYEMSYAFMRRFAFVPIDVPTQISSELIMKYIDIWEYEKNETICANLSKIWEIINSKRKIGPAIIEDLYKYSESGNPTDYSGGLIMYVLPQFEGLLEETQIEFIKKILELDFINNREELKNFASEFFGIDRKKFN